MHRAFKYCITCVAANDRVTRKHERGHYMAAAYYCDFQIIYRIALLSIFT